MSFWMVSQWLGGANFYQQYNSQTTRSPLIPLFDGVDPLLIWRRCPHSGCALLSKRGPSQPWGKTDDVCVLQSKPAGPSVSVRLVDTVTSEPFINSLGFCLDFSGQNNNGTTTCRHHRISCLPTNFSLLKTRIKCHSSLKEGPTCSCWCQYWNLLPAWPLLPCQGDRLPRAVTLWTCPSPKSTGGSGRHLRPPAVTATCLHVGKSTSPTAPRAGRSHSASSVSGGDLAPVLLLTLKWKGTRMVILVVSPICVPGAAGARWSCV